MVRTAAAIAMVLVGAPALAQSRVYTNADLGKPLPQVATVTAEQMRTLTANQFRLPTNYDGPQAIVLPEPEYPRLSPWRDYQGGGLPLWLATPFFNPFFNSLGVPFDRPPVWATPPVPPRPGAREFRKRSGGGRGAPR